MESLIIKFWRAVYRLAGKSTPQVHWRNQYNHCWFSKGYNPNGKIDNERWWRA